MANAQLVQYIKSQRKAGVSQSDIRNSLQSQGWSANDVNAAMAQASGAPAPPPRPGGVSKPEGGLFDFDQKTKETIKYSIYAAITASIIANLFTILSGTFGFGSLIMGILLAGIVGGAIAGWVIAKFYDILQSILQKIPILNLLNTLFKLLFYPIVVVMIISALFNTLFVGAYVGAAALAFGPLGGLIGGALGGRLWWIITVSIIATLVSRYAYAKLMSKWVGQYYRDY